MRNKIDKEKGMKVKRRKHTINVVELLKDGSILRELIKEYQKNRSEETGYPMLACLRDSVLWIPTTAVLSKRDSFGIPDNRKVREKVVNGDPVVFRPAIVRTFHGEAWLPLLTSPDQGDKSKQSVSYVPASALECLSIAHSCDVQGLCLDPYTLGLALPFELADIIRDIPSNIE